MGTKGGCKWSDLLLSNSARKIAFFFFEGLVWVWFALQMRKGWYRKCNWLTQSHTASQWPSWGKNPLSSVWVQMCPRGVNPTCPHTVSHHITGSQDTYQTTRKLPHLACPNPERGGWVSELRVTHDGARTSIWLLPKKTHCSDCMRFSLLIYSDPLLAYRSNEKDDGSKGLSILSL